MEYSIDTNNFLFFSSFFVPRFFFLNTNTLPTTQDTRTTDNTATNCTHVFFFFFSPNKIYIYHITHLLPFSFNGDVISDSDTRRKRRNDMGPKSNYNNKIMYLYNNNHNIANRTRIHTHPPTPRQQQHILPEKEESPPPYQNFLSPPRPLPPSRREYIEYIISIL